MEAELTCWLRLYILRGSLWERTAVCSGTARINVFSSIKRSSNKSSSPRGALARSFTRDDRRSTTTEGGIPVGTTGANEGSEEADGCTDEDGAGDGIEVGELVVGAGVGSGIGTFVGDIVGF